jgi:non-ribosomal peptide synthetase component E (peptide arylation enzyme)
LMRGIELTGDGSESAPFLVSRTSDEYDYLFCTAAGVCQLYRS